MKPIEDLLDSFVFYYSESGEYLQYGDEMKSVLVKKYGYFPSYYIETIYNRVIEEHPKRWGLPGVAEIHKAVTKAGPPETYRTPDAVKQIEAPEPGAEDFIEKIADVLAEVSGKKPPHEIVGHADEPNHQERTRIRARVLRGHATEAEIFWTRVIDEHGGNWMNAYQALGAT